MMSEWLMRCVGTTEAVEQTIIAKLSISYTVFLEYAWYSSQQMLASILRSSPISLR